MILGKSYFLLLILLAGKLTAQTNFVIIDSVHVLGLNKTKKSVVLQETDLHPGDTLALDELATRLNSNEKDCKVLDYLRLQLSTSEIGIRT
ncbi:MAG: hypothetical protein IPG48_14130 [Saprospiraceae bacterium]|nr:hypothetical protein [Saprospiraceae bacterium]